MPNSTYLQSAREWFREKVDDDPGWLQVAYEVEQSSSDLLDPIFGEYGFRDKSLEECAVLGQLAGWWQAGRLITRSIPMPHGSHKDEDDRACQEALWKLEDRSDGLFIGERCSSPTDGPDGRMEWSTSIGFTEYRVTPGGQHDAAMATVDMPPQVAPLENGYCPATRTFFRLMRCGAVARWPYGVERIYLIAVNPEWRLSPEGGWVRRDVKCRRYNERRAQGGQLVSMSGDQMELSIA